MKYVGEMTSGGMIYIPSFIMISSSIQVILRLLLNNLRGCSVHITDERVLFSILLRCPQWHDVHAKLHGDVIQKLFGEEGYTDRQADTHTHQGYLISPLPVLLIRKVG